MFNERLNHALIHSKTLSEQRKRDQIDITHGYVYFAQCGPHTKIGIARNVKRRINSIKTSNPLEVTLLRSFYCPDARKVEQSFHKHFSAFRIRGEWFILPDSIRERLLTTPEEELLLGRLIPD